MTEWTSRSRVDGKITFRRVPLRWVPCFTNFSIWPMSVEEDLNRLPLIQCDVEGFNIFARNFLLNVPPPIIDLPFYQYTVFLWHRRIKVTKRSARSNWFYRIWTGLRFSRHRFKYPPNHATLSVSCTQRCVLPPNLRAHIILLSTKM